jgi:hypothetical protein
MAAIFSAADFSLGASAAGVEAGLSELPDMAQMPPTTRAAAAAPRPIHKGLFDLRAKTDPDASTSTDGNGRLAACVDVAGPTGAHAGA